MSNFTVSLKLDAESGNLRGELKLTEKELKDFEAATGKATTSTQKHADAQDKSAVSSKKQTTALSQVNNALSTHLGRIKAAGPAFVAYKAGQAAVEAATFAYIRPALDAADAVQKLGITYGISTEALSKYSLITKLSGVSMAGFTESLKKQVNNVSEAAQGTGVAVKAFDELGLSAENLNKLAPEKQFEVLAEALRGVSLEQDQVRLAIDFWGRSGVQMLQIVSNNADELNRLKHVAEDAGVVINQNFADASAATNDKLTILEAQFEGIKNTVAQSLLPTFDDTIDSLLEMAVRFNNTAKAGLRFADSIGLIDRDLSLLSESALLLNLAETSEQLLKVSVKIGDIQEKLDNGGGSGRLGLESKLIRLQEESDDLIAKQEEVIDALAGMGDGAKKAAERTDGLTKAQEKYKDELLKLIASPLDTFKKKEAEVNALLATKSITAEQAADAIAKYRAQILGATKAFKDAPEPVKKLTANLDAQVDAWKANKEQIGELAANQLVDYNNIINKVSPAQEDFNQQIAEITKTFNAGEIGLDQFNVLLDSYRDELDDSAPKTKALKTEVGFLEEAFADAGQTMQRDFTDTIRDALDGNIKDIGDWKDFFLDTIKDLVASVAGSGLKNIFSQIFSGGGSGAQTGIIDSLVGGVGSLFGGSSPANNQALVATVAEGGTAQQLQEESNGFLSTIADGVGSLGKLSGISDLLTGDFLGSRLTAISEQSGAGFIGPINPADAAAIDAFKDSIAADIGLKATSVISNIGGAVGGYLINKGVGLGLTKIGLPEEAGSVVGGTLGAIGGVAVGGALSAGLAGGAVGAGAAGALAAIPVAGWAAIAALAVYQVAKVGGSGLAQGFDGLGAGNQILAGLLSGGLAPAASILKDLPKSKLRIGTGTESLELQQQLIDAQNVNEKLIAGGRRTRGVKTPFGITAIQMEDTKGGSIDDFKGVLTAIEITETTIANSLDKLEIDRIAAALDGFYKQEKKFKGDDVGKVLGLRINTLFDALSGRFQELLDVSFDGDASAVPEKRGGDVLNRATAIGAISEGIVTLSEESFQILSDHFADLANEDILPFAGTLSFMDEQFQRSQGIFENTSLSVNDLVDYLVEQKRSTENLTEAYQRLVQPTAIVRDFFTAIGGVAEAATGLNLIDFTEDFVKSAGGEEVAQGLVQSFVSNFGNSEEILQRVFEDQSAQLQKFLDTEGLTHLNFDNFAEQFTDALPTLSGDDLAAWLEAGDRIATVTKLEEQLSGSREVQADAISATMAILTEGTTGLESVINALAGNYSSVFPEAADNIDLQATLWSNLSAALGEALPSLDDITTAGFPGLRDEMLKTAEGAGFTTQEMQTLDTMMKALGVSVAATTGSVGELNQLQNNHGAILINLAQDYVNSQAKVVDFTAVQQDSYDALKATVGDLLPSIDDLSTDSLPALRDQLTEFGRTNGLTAAEIDALILTFNILGGATLTLEQQAAATAEAAQEAAFAIDPLNVLLGDTASQVSGLIGLYEEQFKRVTNLDELYKQVQISTGNLLPPLKELTVDMIPGWIDRMREWGVESGKTQQEIDLMIVGTKAVGGAMIEASQKAEEALKGLNATEQLFLFGEQQASTQPRSTGPGVRNFSDALASLGIEEGTGRNLADVQAEREQVRQNEADAFARFQQSVINRQNSASQDTTAQLEQQSEALIDNSAALADLMGALNQQLEFLGLDAFETQLRNVALALSSNEQQIISLGGSEQDLATAREIAAIQTNNLIATEQQRTEALTQAEQERIDEAAQIAADAEIQRANQLSSILEPFNIELLLSGMSDYEIKLFNINAEYATTLDSAKQVRASQDELNVIHDAFNARLDVAYQQEIDRKDLLEAQAQQAVQVEIDRLKDLESQRVAALDNLLAPFKTADLRRDLSDYEISLLDITEAQQAATQAALEQAATTQDLLLIEQFYSDQRLQLEQQRIDEELFLQQQANDEKLQLINEEIGAVNQQISAHESLIASYSDIISNIASTTQSTVDSITLSLLDTEGKYDFFTQKAEDLANGLSDLYDPNAIKDAIQQINAFSSSAFNLLDDPGKKQNAPEFIEFLQSSADEAQQRVAAAQAAENLALEKEQIAAEALQSAAQALKDAVPEAAVKLSQAAAALSSGAERLQQPPNVNVSVINEAAEVGD